MDNIVIVCEWSGLYRSVFIVTCVYFKKYLTFAYRYIILLYIQKEGDDKVSPRTGRPTDNPKTKQMPIRFSEDDINKLEDCSKKTGKLMAEIVRIGVDKVYKELKERE